MAATAPAATLTASDAATAVLATGTGAGTPGGYPAAYGPVYTAATGALVITSSTAP